MKRWGESKFKRKNTIVYLIKFYIRFLLFIFMLTFIVIIINKPKTPKEQKNIKINKIERSVAYKRALSIINYVWEYNYLKNGINGNKDIQLPNYLKGKITIKTCGIPYCWGGYFSLDCSNSKDVKNFQEAIDRGYSAGNIICSGEYKNFTAGLDCSGFVSAVYNLPEKCSTNTMKYYFASIDIKDLKPMDIFNSENNHTFIYIRESSDKKGIITMEATTGKNSRDKTVIGYRSYDEIKNAINNKMYVPMRYKGIIDDNIELFKDINEFNDTLTFAVLSKEFINGYIEYAEDIDYFYIENNEDRIINVNVKSLPDFCNIAVLDDRGKEIKVLNKGNYNINVKKGKVYIKISSNDFKFSSNEGYEIYIY
ncbi:hypothetical protein FDN13_09515 [Caloramator sp. E03]|uniref:hypothetical protein n=1 Tax=Caloramator sp. E03 TaxID=2576307 RepID=UPI001110ECF1|nr:hypothetical protein [Caloramator sp. E03]QCX33919.1 hypothetical protein FDN13_09515 [Caloramator sp. E03]